MKLNIVFRRGLSYLTLMTMGGFNAVRPFVCCHCVETFVNGRWNQSSEHRIDRVTRDHALTRGVARLADFRRHIEKDCFDVTTVEAGSIYVWAALLRSDIGRIDECQRAREFEAASKQTAAA